jgi:hypothetical protein
MCFSATASFASAALTGSIGVATLSRVRSSREIPLAAMPMAFAAQQAIEGVLWLALPQASEGALSSGLTYAFLLIALAFWPVFAPTAAYLVEPQARRRRIMTVCIGAGIALAGYLTVSAFSLPHTACISNGHITYDANIAAPYPIGAVYLVATAVPLVASSHRAVSVMGWFIIVGSAISSFFYWSGFISVWCFFAAASSVASLVHFEQAARIPTRQNLSQAK